MSIDPRTLDFVSLGVFVTVVLFIIYLVIYIHDIPYEIAAKRNHPHKDAIHAAGWVSLFLAHAIWPLLWIWAYLYTPDKGWGTGTLQVKGHKSSEEEIASLNERLELLEAKLIAATQTSTEEVIVESEKIETTTQEVK